MSYDDFGNSRSKQEEGISLYCMCHLKCCHIIFNVSMSIRFSCLCLDFCRKWNNVYFYFLWGICAQWYMHEFAMFYRCFHACNFVMLYMLKMKKYIFFYFFLFQIATATSTVTQVQDSVADACLTNVVSNRETECINISYIF